MKEAEHGISLMSVDGKEGGIAASGRAWGDKEESAGTSCGMNVMPCLELEEKDNSPGKGIMKEKDSTRTTSMDVDMATLAKGAMLSTGGMELRNENMKIG